MQGNGIARIRYHNFFSLVSQCRTQMCTCSKMGIPCTEVCKCHDSGLCQNPSNVNEKDEESEDEQDSAEDEQEEAQDS